MSQRVCATIVVSNTLGLHARPAMALVDIANAHDCTCRVRNGETDVDATSIMEVMLLAATRGTSLEVTCEGPGAEACLAEIVALAERGFDED